jgi:hypothetical protein
MEVSNFMNMVTNLIILDIIGRNAMNDFLVYLLNSVYT